MAKKTDPFDKFRQATLGGDKALSGALSGVSTREEAHSSSPLPSPAAAKVSKNANRKLVSFHIDSDTFLKLGQLKFEMGSKYDELYNEAVRDLLVKYGKIWHSPTLLKMYAAFWVAYIFIYFYKNRFIYNR